MGAGPPCGTGLGTGVESKSIEGGHEYAQREPDRFGEPVSRVRAVERVRAGKWQVESLHPNPGLVDYDPSRNLIVPWQQLKAFRRDEGLASTEGLF